MKLSEDVTKLQVVIQIYFSYFSHLNNVRSDMNAVLFAVGKNPISIYTGHYPGLRFLSLLAAYDIFTLNKLEYHVVF